MSCKAGKHRWPGGQGKPGAKCAKCGDLYKGRGRPKLKPAAARAPTAAAPAPAPKPKPRIVGDEAAARLAAALGTPAALGPEPPGATTVEVLPASKALPADEPAAEESNDVDDVKSTCAWIARRVTKVFVGLTDWALDLADRQAGEPDDEDEEQFAEGLARALRAKWEDRGLSPTAQMLLAGGFIVGEMCIGSEPKPKPVKPGKVVVLPPLNTPNGASGADMTDEPSHLRD